MEFNLIIGPVGAAKFYMSIDRRIIMIFNHYLHTVCDEKLYMPIDRRIMIFNHYLRAVGDEKFYMSVDLLKIYSALP